MQNIQTGVRIGKEGLKQGVIDEIRKQLRIKGSVKIKLLRAYISANDGRKKKELYAEIAAKAGGEIVSGIGFVLVLKKPGFTISL